MTISPMVIIDTAINCQAFIVFPKTIKASIPAIAPEVLLTGELIETSKCLRPIYPKAIERIYINDTGKYLIILMRSFKTSFFIALNQFKVFNNLSFFDIMKMVVI